MFSGTYLDLNFKKIKFIIDHFGYPYFRGKKILDFGSGFGDISAAFLRLGADVTAIDARNEHLKVAAKKFPGMKTQQCDLDKSFPFQGVDVILDLGLLCHLKNFENHLKNACNACNDLILETSVADSDDPYLILSTTASKDIYDQSYNGFASYPSAKYIENVLDEYGFTFQRFDTNKLNVGPVSYDWSISNTDKSDLNKRRFWIAKRKNGSAMPKAVLPLVHNINRLELKNNKLIAPPPPAPPPQPVEAKSQPFSNPSPVISNRTNRSAFLDTKDKRFVVVIPSYNNVKWAERNINSALTQNYDKFRIIFTDDNSTDGTFEKVKSVVDASPFSSKCTLIKNTERVGALANLYSMIHSCDDDEIILTLDGDDWFPDNAVLNNLKSVYADSDIWLTYGQYRNHPDGGMGVSKAYIQDTIAKNSYRRTSWGASHLRTFYTWLFKKVRKEDLMGKDGKFFAMTWDMAMMFPMLEMAREHHKFLNTCLYVYNLENPINDHKVNLKLQQETDKLIRGRPPYQPVVKPNFIKLNVGLLLIATHKYKQFLNGIIDSADKFFFAGDEVNVSYYVFSDEQPNINAKRPVNYIHIEHRPFPYASMDRYKHFLNNADKLEKEDYIYYCDVDSLFMGNVGTEILGEIVGVRHCGFFNKLKDSPFENNPKSCLYVNQSTYPKKYKYYYGGGFQGGRKGKYLELAKWCNEKQEQDLANGVMPIFNDETSLNRYLLDNPPTISLDPSYHYPQGKNIESYKNSWLPHRFEPRILLLEKNHQEVRS